MNKVKVSARQARFPACLLPEHHKHVSDADAFVPMQQKSNTIKLNPTTLKRIRS